MPCVRKLLVLFSVVTITAAFPAFGQGNGVATDDGLTVWKSIRDTGNIKLLQAYMTTYPNGREARVAGSMINILRSARPAATTGIEADARETAAWSLARTTAQRADVQAYIDSYPNGRYAALARQRLSFLSNPPAETASASQGTIQSSAPAAANITPVAEPETTQTAALHPFDGQWRLTGRANSFKKYAGGFCQNPNSINARLVVADGRIKTEVRSKNSNTAELEGKIDAGGQLDLSITSYFSGWDMFGKTSVKLRKGGGTTSFTVTLKDAGSSGCNYDFSLKRLN